MTEKAELFSSHPTVSKMFSVFRLDPFSALTMLPSRFRPQFNHLFQALIDENDAEANFLLEKIKTLDLSKTIKTKSELDVVGNAFAVALQLSLEDSRKIFPAYFELLELFVQFASFHADLDEFSRHVRKLFQIQDIFCVSYFDQWNRRIVAWENLYKIHVSAIETLFPSPGFQKWAAMRSNTAFLEFFIRDSMIKLVYLAKNHREELFFSLLHECLSLASYYQDLLESLSLLTCFLPTLKDSFFSSDNFKKKNLLEFFTKHFHKSDGSRFQKFIEEILKRLESDGTFPADLSRKLFRNSKSLDVNEIYRQALIEILGDDILTSSEQAILHDLRDFLEIPYDTYQSLFIQVSEELKAGKFPPVSTSFQPERFLRRVFVKILEDGKIEEAETSLLMKVGRALRLDDDFLKTLLNEKLPVDSISETQENSKIQPLQMAISEFEIEKNVVSNLEKSLEKSLIANICSENSFPFGPESFPIALFFDDPKHLSAPLIGICTNQKHASALKLQERKYF
ncbi:hypothetical protein HYY75_05040 [bacterium]|nr:hypothetical protein [bacterium]